MCNMCKRIADFIVSEDYDERLDADAVAEGILALIREPTQEMLDAAKPFADEATAIEIWSRMVDAASGPTY